MSETAFYVEPEVLNKNRYGKEIDWWSVGTIFFKCYTDMHIFMRKILDKFVIKFYIGKVI